MLGSAHFWHDIRPFVCLYNHCAAEHHFTDLKSLLQHIETSHYDPRWVCSSCTERTLNGTKHVAGDRSAVFTHETHLLAHLIDTHKAELTSQELLVVAKHSKAKFLFHACLICGSEQGLSVPEGTSFPLSSRQRQENLAECMRNHLESIALASLPAYQYPIRPGVGAQETCNRQSVPDQREPLRVSNQTQPTETIINARPSKKVFLTLYEFESHSEDAANGKSQVKGTKWRLKEPHHFSDLRSYESFETRPRTSSPGRIFILRGHASSTWLSLIGSTHLVDTEFFSRWSDFPHAVKSHDELPSPALRFGGWKLLELPITSIGRREGVRARQRQHEIDALRSESAIAIRKYHDTLYDRDHGELGASVARDLYVLDDSLFAIEQKITICMQPPDGCKGWACRFDHSSVGATIPLIAHSVHMDRRRR